MKFKDYIEYFETAAINNKVIAHDPTSNVPTFHEVDMETVLTSLRLNNFRMSLIVECPEYTVDDQKSDNIRALNGGAFLILKEVKKDDKVDRRKVLDDTLDVAEQFVSKILNDCRIYLQNKFHPNVIKGFDANSVRIQKTGPFGPNYYGWRVQFTMNQTFKNGLQLNENEWNNETKFQ